MTNKPELNIEELRDLFAYDSQTGIFIRKKSRTRFRVGLKTGYTNIRGYLNIRVGDKRYLGHRLAWALFYGKWPLLQIDHIDGNTSNNQISNLREVTSRLNLENQRRAHKDSTTGFLGIVKSENRWQARINVDGKRINLGSFKTPELASEAYINAKRKMHVVCSI